MRCAREAAANPPNTTAWMAPRRAVARIANTAEGIIGTEGGGRNELVGGLEGRRLEGLLTVDEYCVSLLDALFLEHCRQGFYFFQQLLVRELLFLPRDWRVPDDCHGAFMTSFDMSVYTIVCCRNLSAWKPRPMLMLNSAGQPLRCPLQCLARLLVPGQSLSLSPPKLLRIGQGLVLNLIL